MAKKFLYFGATFLAVMGFVGGIGCAIYARSYVVAAAVLVLGAMAFPTFKQCLTKITK